MRISRFYINLDRIVYSLFLFVGCHSVSRAVPPCRHERALGYPVDIGHSRPESHRPISSVLLKTGYTAQIKSVQITQRFARWARECGAGNSMVGWQIHTLKVSRFYSRKTFRTFYFIFLFRACKYVIIT